MNTSANIPNTAWDALALFSGGLDSILAVKVLQEQGLNVLGLHYVSPFFGKPHLLGHWRSEYGIEVIPVDVRRPYLDMLAAPAHGYGKHLNPCVDCKILMLRHARGLLETYGAKFLVSGEVLGQRPMSQRADTLNLIRKDAGVTDVLLRPLSAQKLGPTPMEQSGLVDRERLPGIWGRGRRGQLELAEHFGVTDIPTPAGGCRLAEIEPAARYLPVLSHLADPRPEDFQLSHLGRQYWAGPFWLSIGRNEAANKAMEAATKPDDLRFRLKDFVGPLAVGRQYAPKNPVDADAARWPEAVVADAAAFAASYSPRARAEADAGRPVTVLVLRGNDAAEVRVTPARTTPLDWTEPKSAALSLWKKGRL
ncbi:MAG: tRNA(5-methylaminomethyl-2-thiouridylate) methyltransferase [Desulfovibrionaceae bacterium CG1_02_65_16]|nr:MAG: tRNA(5-methylaminomethyl-2-thiouridylate) methyltransferase [Desulfovibrionaceae bacterium CG1_02_65_16]